MPTTSAMGMSPSPVPIQTFTLFNSNLAFDACCHLGQVLGAQHLYRVWWDTMDSIFLPRELNTRALEADLSRRWDALRQNIPEFYSQISRTSKSPSVFRTGDIVCTTLHCTIPSEKSVDEDQLLDSIIDWFRKHLTKDSNGAIMWYLHPMPPVNLDARLYARGVCPNWEPHWMCCELTMMKRIEKLSEKITVQIQAENDEAANYEGRCLAWKIDALRKEQWLGGCTLMVANGERSVGGLFDMHVQVQERRQGIGTILTVAACELAIKQGCHYLLLNATDEGESVYRRVGFQSMGKGRTWFLNGEVLARPPPSSTQVKFLEAIGMGDIKSLDTIKDGIAPEQMSKDTVNGETPLEIAVRCEQPLSSQWLIDHGVVPDIMSLWDLGWRDRIPALLAMHPELVLRKSGRWAATPLHTAIERGDVEMAKLLLSVPIDLNIKDGVMQSTPMGWAKYFQRTEIIALIELAKLNVS